MYGIRARMAAIAEELERRRLEQEAPIDDLSRSLFDYEAWLISLDEQGKREFLEALNGDGLNLQAEDVDAMARGARR